MTIDFYTNQNSRKLNEPSLKLKRTKGELSDVLPSGFAVTSVTEIDNGESEMHNTFKHFQSSLVSDLSLSHEEKPSAPELQSQRVCYDSKGDVHLLPNITIKI